MYNQYQNCKQGTRYIVDYIEEFHRLGAWTNLGENEQLVARYTGGQQLALQPIGYLNEAISMAATIEEHTDISSILRETAG